MRRGRAGGVEAVVKHLPVRIPSSFDGSDEDRAPVNLIEHAIRPNAIPPRGWTIVAEALDIRTARRISSEDRIHVISQFLPNALLLM
jgi:hypothetical protein